MNRKTDAKRLVAGFALALAVAPALAMPTKKDLAAAQPTVQDLTAGDMRAMRAKEKTPSDVAAAHIALADKAETEAGKYLLLQGAFGLYARGGDYDSAAAVLQRMRTEISNLPPEVVIEIVSKEMRRVAGSKAPKVLAIFHDAQRTVKNRKRLTTLRREANAKPTDAPLQRRLAECYACLGDWDKALPIFAKLGDAAAKYELDPASANNFSSTAAADFWWDYKADDDNPFKAHAAALYRVAIDGGVATGLRREIAAKRLAEFEASGMQVAAAATTAAMKWAIPANFKDSIVRTLKLSDDVNMDFCACPAGTFQMSNVPEQEPRSHKVTITRPFWISRQFVTSQQNRAAGGNLVDDDVAQELEKAFPGNDIILNAKESVIDSFISIMNERFGAELPKGYVFRLPTEAELEYAIRAGGKYTSDAVYLDIPRTLKALVSKGFLGEEEKNSKGIPKAYHRFYIFERTPENPWKIIGGWTNSAQLTLDHVEVPKGVDWRGNSKENLVYANEEVDPLRSGNRWLKRQWHTARWLGTGVSADIFRIVVGPDLVAEKKVAAKK